MNNIAKQYQQIRSYTEVLCRPLKPEDYVVQIVEFASPAKWHLAHTSWFFETFVLLPHLKHYKPYNKDFSYLFNSYYNTVGERVLRAKRGNLSRPTVDEIYDYRHKVDTAMLLLLSNNLSQDVLDLIELGLQHEQQHQELLLSDIKYMFGHHPLFPAYDSKTKLSDNDFNKEEGWVHMPEGIYTIGYQGNDFCFDNELGVHKVYLQQYKISKSLVTNEEYMEFIEDGGYNDFNLWLDEGWKWIKEHQVSAPLYWHKIDGTWMHYSLKGFKALEEKSILKHINFYEAMAFAQYKGKRLPTEFEWEVASSQLEWGQRWEWTNSAYLPYPGFKKAKGAIGEYNGKFMVNQMVLKGASMATPSGHSRASYRNFFHPNAQWQFSGIRLAL